MPSDVNRVLGWFGEGRLLRPGSSGMPSLVDLAVAVASCAGAEPALSAGATRVRALIGEAEHYVVVLVDGLGLELLQRWSPRGFLATHVATGLETTFPSTTAVALTSLASGTYPAEHGIPGWWVYLEELATTSEILPFTERFTKRALPEIGANVGSILVCPSSLPRFSHVPLVVTEAKIVNSTYSRYSSGDCERVGYTSIQEGVDAVVDRLARATGPTYTSLYLPQLDAVCHKLGIDDARCGELASKLDRHLEDLARSLPRARLIVTADHGHINAARARDFLLREDDPLTRHLVCPPTGEPTVPVFHVHSGSLESFAREFRAAHGEFFALLTTDEVESLRLLGPGPLSPSARKRFGNFLAIAPEATTLNYVQRDRPPTLLAGVHAGLTPAEMIVPLVVV